MKFDVRGCINVLNSKIEDIHKEYKQINKILSYLQDQDKRLVKDLTDHSDLYTNLQREVTFCKNSKDEYNKRILQIENSLSFSNLPQIIIEVNKISEEYNEKIKNAFNKIKSVKSESDYDFLFQPIDKLDLCIRGANCLKAVGIIFIGDIICNKYSATKCDKKYRQLLFYIPNFGKKLYKELVDSLNSLGFCESIFREDYWIERKKRTGLEWDGNFAGRIHFEVYENGMD